MANSKPNIPWSVKGIDPDARTVAKDAAKKAGMTLGEWITQTIHEQANGDPKNPGSGNPGSGSDASASESVAQIPSNVVTVEQLRDVVDSLNRMNQRLRKTEDNTKVVAQTVNEGMGSVLDRLKKVESAAPDTNVFAERLDKLEKGGNDADRVDSLKSLEGALRGIVQQYETTHTETIERVSASESAVQELTVRVDQIDHQTTASFEAVSAEIEKVNQQISQAETSARSVMAEVRDASGTDDIEFIERTGKKLRILGAEIKRSGDQIQILEAQIRNLSGQIEASEKRSAEGILKVSATIDGLRRDVGGMSDEGAVAVQKEAEQALVEATADAEDRLTDLQDNFDHMLSKLDHVSDNQESRAAAAKAVAADVDEEITDLGADFIVGDDTPVAKDVDPVPTEEADFDAIFEGNDDDPEDIKAVRDAVTSDDNGAGTARKELPKNLTPKQKVILAARARRRRLEKQAAATGAAAAATVAATAVAAKTTTKEIAGKSDPITEALEPQAEEEQQGLVAKLQSLPSKLFRKSKGAQDIEATSEVDTSDEELKKFKSGQESTKSDKEITDTERAALKSTARRAPISDLRAKYQDREVKENTNLIPLLVLGLAALAIIVGAYFLWQNISKGGTSEVRQQPPVTETAKPSTGTTTPATPSSEDYKALYTSGTGLLNNATTPSERVRAFQMLRRAAAGGHVPAQYQVAEMYRLGDGVQASSASAARWYEDAANDGNVYAMHKLAYFYITGEGVVQDAVVGLEWFEKAANFGLADSMFNLGFLYAPTNGNADGEPTLPADLQSAEKSYYWYKLTGLTGDPDAPELAAEVGSQLTLEKRLELDAKAASWVQTPLDEAANELIRVER